MNFVRPRAQRDCLPSENEEAFLSRFHLVLVWRKIPEGEAPGGISFGAVILAGAALQRDFRGGEGHAIFVHDYAGALAGVSGGNSCGGESAQESKERGDSSCRTHVSSWHTHCSVRPFCNGAISRRARAAIFPHVHFLRCGLGSFFFSGCGSEIQAGGSLAGKDSSEASSTGSGVCAVLAGSRGSR